MPSGAYIYGHVNNSIVHINLGHLGQVDIPVGQVAIHSPLLDGQEIK